MTNYQYLVPCENCGQKTSKKFARANNGKCKSCVTGQPREDTRTYKQRYGHCEDSPCCGCCGPQGDGDFYGYQGEY